jgi:predicted O-methyltransferase YrrM
MAYYNWFNTYFKEKHKNSTADEKINDVLLMLEARGSEYLVHNYETYKQLWIDPNEDIVNSKPQIIQQIREELYDFLKLLIDNDVKKVLQIGLGHFGSTHFCLSLLFDEVVTVEYDIKNIANYSNRELLHNQNKEHFIYGSSIDESVINKTKVFGEFDAVFIDGNHSYEYVKKDWENYSKLVKKGGIVSFHDALLDADRYGTPKVLSETGKDITLIKHSKEVGIAYYIND